MAGFGGAMKNISIGIASLEGKAQLHAVQFICSMAEAAKSVCAAMKGRIVFVNVLNRLSIDCDCEEDPAAPEMKDIGILASWDPAAIDQASVDLVLAAPDGGRLAARIREHGFATLEHAEAVGLGRRRYRLLKA